MDEAKRDKIEKFIQKHGAFRKCECGELMYPSRETFVEEVEEMRDLIVTLVNFPIFNCSECERISYSPYLHMKYRKNAIKQYQTDGNVLYNCDIETFNLEEIIDEFNEKDL